LHEATVHAPAAQPAVPLVVVQALPHAPQWLGSVVSARSQPLASLASQLPKPVLQLPILQLPVEHVGVAFVREQVVPQAPQCASVSSFCSQPSEYVVLQLA
jgi:hypothetical protein